MELNKPARILKYLVNFLYDIFDYVKKGHIATILPRQEIIFEAGNIQDKI